MLSVWISKGKNVGLKNDFPEFRQFLLTLAQKYIIFAKWMLYLQVAHFFKS